MGRAIGALREWRRLRLRLRDEHRFHLEQAAAEFRIAGISRREANRKARRRFGNRRHLRLALRELGADLPGLVDLFRVHRVLAPAWVQPALLLTAVILILFVSPAPRALVEGVIGTPPGNGSFLRSSLFQQTRVATGPAKTVWVLIACGMAFLLRDQVRLRGTGRWLVYGALVAFLHSVTSLMAWAVAIQICSGGPSSPGNVTARTFSALFLAWLLTTVLQYRHWWRDLNQRCPVCFDRLLLPLTEGTAGRILLCAPVTESVCAHGHGVLVESRWATRFRPQESPLRGLVGL